MCPFFKYRMCVIVFGKQADLISIHFWLIVGMYLYLLTFASWWISFLSIFDSQFVSISVCWPLQVHWFLFFSTHSKCVIVSAELCKQTDVHLFISAHSMWVSVFGGLGKQADHISILFWHIVSVYSCLLTSQLTSSLSIFDSQEVGNCVCWSLQVGWPHFQLTGSM